MNDDDDIPMIKQSN